MNQKLNNKLNRLYLMVSALQRNDLSKEDLFELLADHGIHIKEATFNRDKRSLKEDFGIHLDYDKTQDAYVLLEIDRENAAQLLQFLQFYQLSDFLKESIRDGASSLRYIDFENEHQLSGIEHLENLFMATKQHRVIHFKHRMFGKPEALEYTMYPYLVKQFQSRWYVVGEVNGHIRTFGIDRITDVRLSEQKFSPYDMDLKKDFKSCVGVSRFQEDKQYVQIAFHRSQKPYLEHLPFHHSQDLLREDDELVVYEYHLVDNFELRQHILKYGSFARVLQPAYLADGIRDDLKKALEQY